MRLQITVCWAVSLNLDLDSEALLSQKRFLIKCHVSGIQIWAGNPGPGPPTPPRAPNQLAYWAAPSAKDQTCQLTKQLGQLVSDRRRMERELDEVKNLYKISQRIANL